MRLSYPVVVLSGAVKHSLGHHEAHKNEEDDDLCDGKVVQINCFVGRH